MKAQPGSARVKFGLAAAAALGLSLAVVPTAVAQPQALAAKVVVSPSAALPATIDVTVDISGFKPRSAVFTQQCAQVTETVVGCDWSHTQSLILGEGGEGKTRLNVRRVFEAHDENGNPIGPVDCASVKPGCFVAVGNRQEGSGVVLAFA
ncbi:enediyne antibiotic chromoprotein [Saccharothrix sp. BKS2]|uniref:enediyne antibiotic chromoprotein n=1 Tax=Saccharothrix sp. BKS2 TaxID=3064400 RepID=UPI0039E8C4E1